MVRIGFERGVPRVGDRGFLRVGRIPGRVVRRTIRRVIIVDSIINRNNERYCHYHNNYYQVIVFDGKNVIEDPDDDSAYLEVKLQN